MFDLLEQPKTQRNKNTATYTMGNSGKMNWPGKLRMPCLTSIPLCMRLYSLWFSSAEGQRVSTKPLTKADQNFQSPLLQSGANDMEHRAMKTTISWRPLPHTVLTRPSYACNLSTELAELENGVRGDGDIPERGKFNW